MCKGPVEVFLAGFGGVGDGGWFAGAVILPFARLSGVPSQIDAGGRELSVATGATPRAHYCINCF